MTTTTRTHTQVCTCPMDTLYTSAEVCDFCVTVAFHDDPQYAEMMGYTLTNGVWVLS